MCGWGTVQGNIYTLYQLKDTRITTLALQPLLSWVWKVRFVLHGTSPVKSTVLYAYSTSHFDEYQPFTLKQKGFAG